MKGKKITSLMCAGAMLFGFAAAPISTAQAYTVSDKQSGDPAYEKPLEVKARYEEGRNHYFDIQAYLTDSGLKEDKMLSDEFEHDLIMPGDTFEIPIYITEGHTVYYMGAANSGGDDTTVPNYNSITTDYLSSTYFYKGYEYSGEVTPIKTVTKTFGTGADSQTWKFCTKWKNNTDCPLFIECHGWGSGPAGGDYIQAHGNLNLYLLAPYYGIYYNASYGDGSVGMGDTIKLQNFFYRQGNFSDFTFPEVYWITDTPYSFTIPNPTTPGRHFTHWSKDKSDEFPGMTQTEDYTTFTVKFDYKNMFNYNNGFGGCDRVYISPGFVEGTTITFNGNGGTIKGFDKYVAEIPEYDEENDNYGYALEDYVPVKDGDTFLGWCSKEDTYYDSFLTKDDEAVIYDRFCTSKYWTRTSDIVLYAKWANDTEEELEKNGWEITDDGTLWLLDNTGAQNWNNARQNDPTLSEKVKGIKLGFRDKKVTSIPNGCFIGCSKLVSAEFDDNVKDFSSWCFQNCTSLKTVKFGKNVSVGYGVFKGCASLETVTFEGAPSYASQAFFYAPINVLVKIADGDNEGFVSALQNNLQYAYLLNDEERYPLTVNGELITENNLIVACGSGTASFDPKSNTLTLDNAELTNAIVPHTNIDLQSAGVVSILPELNVVVKGTMRSVEADPFNASGSLNITGADKNASIEEVSEYSGKSYAIIRTTGTLSLNNMSITALNALADTVYVDSCELSGGLSSEFNSKTNNIVIKNSTVKQYVNGENTFISAVYGVNITADNSTFDNVKFISVNGSISIKDCTASVNNYIIGGTEGKLSITNSTVTGTGQIRNGMTNIPEANITLTDCEITKGGWKNVGEFEILPLADPEPYPYPPEPGKVYFGGDIDLDALITANDALLILRASVGLENIAPEYFVIADVDEDGALTAGDALAVLRASVGFDYVGNIGKVLALVE